MRPILIAALFALIASSPADAAAHCGAAHSQPEKPRPEKDQSSKRDPIALKLRFSRKGRE